MMNHPRFSSFSAFSSLVPSLRLTAMQQLRQHAMPLCISAVLWALALLWSQHGNAAVLADDSPLEAAAIHVHSTAPSLDTDQSPVYDLGYFTLEAESCLPLGPAAATITAFLRSTRAFTTRDAAALGYHWRQVQHHKAESARLQQAPQCFYIAQ